MPAIRKLPDATTLRRMRTQGLTQKQIAETYGVSESAVWKALKKYGYTESIATYKDILPWEIEEFHKSTAIMERFRSIVRQRMGGDLLPEDERKLEAWLHDLETNDLVVNYHPLAPANDASSKGGFYYVPRSAADDWIIRRPTPH